MNINNYFESTSVNRPLNQKQKSRESPPGFFVVTQAFKATTLPLALLQPLPQAPQALQFRAAQVQI